jgi:hypothetical protein
MTVAPNPGKHRGLPLRGVCHQPDIVDFALPKSSKIRKIDEKIADQTVTSVRLTSSEKT